MSKYLVTGGAGFIGSHIVRKLLDGGHDVRVLDNLSTGRRENLAGLANVEFLHADIRDPDACDGACRDAEYVIHQAAFISVPASMKDPRTAHDVNVTGTLNLMEASVRHGVRRFVYASSCAVYGDAASERLAETEPPRPLSPYASTKLICEQYADLYGRCFGLSCVGLRYFNVYGPRQDPQSEYAAVIPKFLERVTRGDVPAIFGDGSQTRDFIFVGDVAAANLAACRADTGGSAVVNVASGKSTTVLELARTIMALAGMRGSPRFEPPRAGDILHSAAETDGMRDMLSLPDPVPWTGIGNTLAWLTG
ncbi:MAG: NAD-dependent epimerase/dehydratase family protein [Deltaproteobacteria bacterium]|nr:NAD-dependent epimerase/dehydratase family protein [Deltaproteobacteria bacterium]